MGVQYCRSVVSLILPSIKAQPPGSNFVARPLRSGLRDDLHDNVQMAAHGCKALKQQPRRCLGARQFCPLPTGACAHTSDRSHDPHRKAKRGGRSVRRSDRCRVNRAARDRAGVSHEASIGALTSQCSQKSARNAVGKIRNSTALCRCCVVRTWGLRPYSGRRMGVSFTHAVQ